MRHRLDKSPVTPFLAGMTPALALLGDLGGGEILVIGILALLLFGSKRLPELGRAFGRAMREFKRATSGVEENLREVMREDPLAPKVRPAPRQIARRGSNTPTASSRSPAAPAASDPSGTSTNVIKPPPAPSPGSSPLENSAGAEEEIAS